MMMAMMVPIPIYTMIPSVSRSCFEYPEVGIETWAAE